MTDERPISVLFVCLGNICRSPTAEGVLTARLAEAGLCGRIRVDSAGTGDWHLGRPPDPRTLSAAGARGYDLGDLRARQLRPEDFHAFDYLLAMDRANLRELERQRPQGHRGALELFLRAAGHPHAAEVPDPYAGDASHFEAVLDLIEDGVDRLLAVLRSRHSV